MKVKTTYCSDDSEYYTEMEAFMNARNQIFIIISKPDGDMCESQHIVLDKKTAIRLAQDLRREISFMED